MIPEKENAPNVSRETLLLNALRGIASCATRCGCCEMHRRIAEEVLKDYEILMRSSEVVF